MRAVLVDRALVEVLRTSLFLAKIRCFIKVIHKIVIDFSYCVAIRVARARDSTHVLVQLTVVGP